MLTKYLDTKCSFTPKNSIKTTGVAVLALLTIVFITTLPVTVVANTPDSIYHYIRQSKHYRMDCLEKSKQYARQALQMSKKSGTDTLIMDSHLSLGLAKLVQRRFHASDSLFKLVKTTAQKQQDLYREARAAANRSLIMLEQQKYDELISQKSQMLQKLKGTPYILLRLAFTETIVKAYKFKEEYDQAFTLMEQYSMLIDSILPNDPSAAIVNTNKESYRLNALLKKAELHMATGNYAQAIKILESDTAMQSSYRQALLVHNLMVNNNVKRAITEHEKILLQLSNHNLSATKDQWLAYNKFQIPYAIADRHRNELSKANRKLTLNLLFLTCTLLLIVFMVYRLNNKNKQLECYKKENEEQKRILEEHRQQQKEQRQKDARERNEAEEKRIIKALEEVARSQWYKSPKATIEQLTTEVNTNRTKLSEILNEKFGGFNQWKNQLLLNEALEIIDQNIRANNNVTVLQLSDELGISIGTLTNIFKQFEKKSPGKYIALRKKQLER